LSIDEFNLNAYNLITEMLGSYLFLELVIETTE